MSTILKALRRLEEDRPPASSTPTPETSPRRRPGSVPDPGATDQLRGRILDEEAAARIGVADDEERSPLASLLTGRKIAVAAILLTTIGLIGLIGHSLSQGGSESSPGVPQQARVLAPVAPVAAGEAPANTTTTVPPPAPAQLVAAPVPVPSSTAALPPAEFAPTEAKTPLAAVSPTRAAAAASRVPDSEATRAIEPSDRVAMHTPPTPPLLSTSPLAERPSTRASAARSTPTSTTPLRPRPSVAERAPSVVFAAAADPVSEPDRTRVAAGRSARAPSRPPLSQPSKNVERIDHRGLPDVSVIRTSWHPQAARRSARIRLQASEEILNLKEGDAVGGLVVKEISPSSVLFAAGEIEIRRRVGQSSGG